MHYFKSIFWLVPLGGALVGVSNGCGNEVAFEIEEETQFASLYDSICTSGPEQPSICSGQAGLNFIGPNTDASCSTANSSTGAACTQDCLVPCGFNRLGMKSCSCEGGSYSACPCLEPPSYEGADFAPPCSEIPDSGGSNLISALDPGGPDVPCDIPWQQCVGTDPDELGNANRGCVCLPLTDPTTLNFFEPIRSAWFCAATNRWFTLEVPD